MESHGPLPGFPLLRNGLMVSSHWAPAEGAVPRLFMCRFALQPYLGVKSTSESNRRMKAARSRAVS